MKSIFRFMTLAILLQIITPFAAKAQSVSLQSSTPGTKQTGHMNISGSGLFGRSIGIGTLSPGNNTGVYVLKSLSASTVNGIYTSVATTASAGTTYGGYFNAGSSSSVTGTTYGVFASGLGNSASNTLGIYGKSLNTSSGVAYGVYGQSDNTSSGQAIGGFFSSVNVSGTGENYGVYGRADGRSNASTYGVYGRGFSNNTSAGPVYGGSFSANATYMGYGVYGSAGSSSASGTACGGCFQSEASGTGYGVSGNSISSAGGSRAYGGYFTAAPVTMATSTALHYGIYAAGTGGSAANTYGVFGTASNSSSGTTYGGYFTVSPSGTGIHYGIFAVEAAGGSGAAVYASGDFVASGTKNAVVKTTGGHRLLYALESAEVWFDDYGQGRLVNGQAQVALDPFFLETVTITGAHPMKVFIQLTSGEPVPVVVEKGETGFVVRAPNQLNATFDYRVVAKRKGYENDRLRITETGREDPNLYPERWAEMEKRMAEERQVREAERERHNRDRRQHERFALPEEPAPQPEAVPEPEVINFNAPAAATNEMTAPEANALIQNHPNPFNPATKIQFEVKQPGRVTLKVYNSLGQEVASLVDQYLPAGRHTTNFDASSLPSGAYFYKLSVNGFTEVKRMELVK